MKTVRLIIAVLLVLSVSSAVDVFAQENNNRDENGKIVRGPYETNRLFDNVWIGVAGGINLYEMGFNDPGPFGGRISAAIDINIGKWVTPSVGLRIGYSGLTASGWSHTATPYSPNFDEGKGLYKKQFGTMFVHGDVMWNISNAFSGYKETRVWNFIPFLSAGVAYSYKNGTNYSNKEFAVAVGLLNNIRLSNRIDLTLELRQFIVNGNYDSSNQGGLAGMSSVTLGVAVKLGKTNFNRSNRAANEQRIGDLEALNKELNDNNSALNKANDDLTNENKGLQAKIKDMEDNPQVVVERIMLDVTPCTVFFEIGQTVLSERELAHLDFYIKNVIEQDSEKTFTLIGSADKQTGSKRRNQQLSQMRVDYVCDILLNKYNIPAERLIIKSEGSENNRFEEPALNRAVTIE